MKTDTKSAPLWAKVLVLASITGTTLAVGAYLYRAITLEPQRNPKHRKRKLR